MTHTYLSAGSAVAALAKRFWSIHPKEIQDIGITREQFYEREMLSLLATLVPTEPQAARDPEVVDAVKQAIMKHPHFSGGHVFAFGLANTAIDAYTLALTRPQSKGDQ